MEITTKEAETIYYGDSKEYESVNEETILDKGRWSITYSKVYKKIVDNTFWELTWIRGATETQDEGMEYPELNEVVPVQKTITVYEAKL